jgi:hypothetical protein
VSQSLRRNGSVNISRLSFSDPARGKFRPHRREVFAAAAFASVAPKERQIANDVAPHHTPIFAGNPTRAVVKVLNYVIMTMSYINNDCHMTPLVTCGANFLGIRPAGQIKGLPAATTPDVTLR